MGVADAVGVVALIGTPADTFDQVVTLTQGQEVAAKLLSTIQKERDEPTGQPAFPASPVAPPLFGLCGVFGLEAAVGLFAWETWFRESSGESQGESPGVSVGVTPMGAAALVRF